MAELTPGAREAAAARRGRRQEAERKDAGGIQMHSQLKQTDTHINKSVGKSIHTYLRARFSEDKFPLRQCYPRGEVLPPEL